MKKVDANLVVKIFEGFIGTYHCFRADNGLKSIKKNPMDPFEICTSMLDKLGRIARQVKHTQRNDPKPDWPNGMTEAMTGLLVYMIMLLDSCGVDISDGMKTELLESIKQYKK